MSSFYYTTPSGKPWWLTAQSPSSSPFAPPLNNDTSTTREGQPGPIDPNAATSSSTPAIMADNSSPPPLLNPGPTRRRARRARRQPASHSQGGPSRDIDGENISPSTATRPARPTRERRTTTRARQRIRQGEASCSGQPQYRRVMVDLPQNNVVAPRSRARTLREIDEEASSSSQ